MKRGVAMLACAGFLAVAVAAAQPSPTPTPTPTTPPDKPAEKPPEKPVTYVEGRGLVFRTPDNLFEGSLGFNLQARYGHVDLDAAVGGLDTNQFRVRRFKLFMNGFAFDPRLTWRVQLAFESNVANRILDDAWLGWKFADPVAIQMGQYKTPYSRQELYNDGVLQFPERSLATDAFKPSRDIGFMTFGSLGKGLFTYQAGVFGGAGQSNLRTTENVMPVVRLVANPIGTMGASEADIQNHAKPALSFGANGFVNTLRKLTDIAFEAELNYAGPAGWLGRNVSRFQLGEEVDIESWGLDAQFKWCGFSLQAEGFWGQAKGQTSGARVYAYGWYAQAGYFILPEKLDLAGRYSYVDYNRSVSRGGVSVISAATSYYFRRNSLKVVLDYSRTHRQRPSGQPANDSAFIVQAQLMP
jgi:phosphate-selective porin OprO and OprP